MAAGAGPSGSRINCSVGCLAVARTSVVFSDIGTTLAPKPLAPKPGRQKPGAGTRNGGSCNSSAMSANSARMSDASANRASGSRDVARAMNSSNCGGTPPITELGGGNVVVDPLIRHRQGAVAGERRCPGEEFVRQDPHRIDVASGLALPLLTCSGDRYAAVPRITLVEVIPASASAPIRNRRA